MSDLPWEDSLLERKLKSDLKDLLKTVVAFANSVRPGHTAVILIGERNDGTVQGVDDPDRIQKYVRETCDKVYPPILWRAKVYKHQGAPCVRVEIDYDGDTPHFGGPAWIRRGSETILASDDLFQSLVAFRLSKVRELAKWLAKEVSVMPDLGTADRFVPGVASMEFHPRWPGERTALLKELNAFWATFDSQDMLSSEPLGKLTLSWDNLNARLAVLVSI